MRHRAQDVHRAIHEIVREPSGAEVFRSSRVFARDIFLFARVCTGFSTPIQHSHTCGPPHDDLESQILEPRSHQTEHA